MNAASLEPRPLLTAAAIAARIGCSDDFAYVLMKNEMTHVKVGNLIRVREEDFEEWLASKRREPRECASTNAASSGGVPSRGKAKRFGVVRAARRAPPPCSLPSDGSASVPTPITQPRRPRRSEER